MTDSIATARLRLVPLTPPLLRAVARGDLAAVERELGARVGTGWEDGVPATLRLEQLAADASAQPWLVRAMVAPAPRQVVGSVGFHAPPDDDGRAEIGYDVVAAERRNGYAREGSEGCSSGLGRPVASGRASPPSVRTTHRPSP